ncbi:NADPH-dependent 7-cyano-7-deazaguanine reductase [hydrothermal vent metagenome]|uniref:NADPH-dependent 7-cyano-7-deazaguanine reductase n=1 Tax=hydrothermal vent metagenome TaxID=652676 RepID=A0A3B0ZNY2_9ZZZZ
MSTQANQDLEVFDNPNSDRDYTIKIELPEFTCLCPKTGQPDFATIYLDYIPNKFCIELKSLKFYIWSYRDTGAFHEAVTNTMLDHFVAACAPRFMRVRANFNVRGGVYTDVIAEHQQDGWKPKAKIELD